jgi:hypothetical protein
MVLIVPGAVLALALGPASARAQERLHPRLEAQAELAPIEILSLDNEAIGSATFQSHNQKVVANARGIFTAHVRTRNQAYTAQAWRLSWSQDGGRTFATLFEATHATNPPVLETDAAGNVYLVCVDFERGRGHLYRFLAAEHYLDPEVTSIPGAAAGKYAMRLDEPRARLYFFAHNGSFHTVALDGEVQARVELIKPGPHAELQYPLLALDGDGRLHAAWTTQKDGEYLYWSIHHMLSEDGGASWRRLDGEELELPVVADDTGPTLGIVPPDELGVHTWLANVLARAGKLHFLYEAQTSPPRQHYVRYDIASAERDVDLQPRFGGETIALLGLDGFFAADPQDEDVLYCVGNDMGHLVCLKSTDRGATWQDHARSEQAYRLYSIGGYRWTHAGWILGTFTDDAGAKDPTERSSKVYFFRIRAE